jgi:hypothetical protein
MNAHCSLQTNTYCSLSHTHQPTIYIPQLLQLEQICRMFRILKDVWRRPVDGHTAWCALSQTKDDGWIRIVPPVESDGIESLWLLIAQKYKYTMNVLSGKRVCGALLE